MITYIYSDYFSLKKKGVQKFTEKLLEPVRDWHVSRISAIANFWERKTWFY